MNLVSLLWTDTTQDCDMCTVQYVKAHVNYQEDLIYVTE